MTNIRNALMQAAGSASGDKVYVEDVFATHLYDGTSGTSLSINNGIDLAGEGGLVWIKERSSGGGSHKLLSTDASGNHSGLLDSSSTSSAGTGYQPTYFTQNNNGFTTTNTVGDSKTNGNEYTSWSFRIQEGFFDVVKFTAGTNTDRQISHSLSCVPGMIIVKDLDAGYMNWQIYHKSLGQSKIIYLNLTQAASTGNPWWGTTTHSSSNFSINESYLVNGNEHIAYLFADGDSSDAQIFGDDGDEAIIKTGTYQSDGNGNEVYVDLGFEPQWIMIKSSTDTQSWIIQDNMRGMAHSTSTNNYLLANSNGAENSEGTAGMVRAESNGMTIGVAGIINMFNSVQTYTYMAIRRGPMKEPSAGTDVFKAISRTGGGGSASITGVGFSPDLYLSKATNQGSYNPLLYNRLRGKRYLLTSATDAQPNSDGGLDSYDMDGVSVSGGSSFGLDGSGDSIINYFFKRYPKVFDVVVYSPLLSDPVPRNVHNHNLTVKPELIIVKQTTSVYGARNWAVGAPDLLGVTSSDTLGLNLDVAEGGTGTYNLFDSTQPTATQFTVGYNTTGVGVFGESYIAYLFASLDGISKVGTYTGTGNDLNVTGLNAAARFVLIKRTDASGDWYVYDSTSGIVSGNDPYFFINSTAVSVTNTDYIDPHSSGFTVTSSAPAALNASSGTYIYLAFA